MPSICSLRCITVPTKTLTRTADHVTCPLHSAYVQDQCYAPAPRLIVRPICCRYGGAFAKILDSIPENVKNLDPQVAKSAGSHTPSEEGTSDSALSSHLAYLDDASSSNEQVLEAVAAAVERATEQQRHQAVSLDAGQAYPEYTAQVCQPKLDKLYTLAQVWI